MYRLYRDVRGYLSFEVIGLSKQDVLDRFAAAVRARCKISKGDWAEDEIERVKWSDIETLGPGVTIDGEPFFGD